MPGEHRPSLSQSQASELVKKLFGLTPSLLRQLPSYYDRNLYVSTAEGGEYVLKVMNSADSKNTTLLEVQTHTMAFLHQHGLPAQTALPTTTGQLMEIGINPRDFNDLSVLVQQHKISGILDFGDMSSGFYIYELAIIIITHMMFEHPEPLEVGGPVLAGWVSIIPLNTVERDALYLLALARLCQTLVLPQLSLTLQPENEDYLMAKNEAGIQILCQLWEGAREEMERMWFQEAAQYSERVKRIAPDKWLQYRTAGLRDERWLHHIIAIQSE